MNAIKNCPLCGTEFEGGTLEKHLVQTGWDMSEVKTMANGEFKFAVKAGILVVKSWERTGEKTIDFSRNFEQLKEHLEKLNNVVAQVQEQRQDLDSERQLLEAQRAKLGEEREEFLRQIASDKDSLFEELNSEKQKLQEEKERFYEEQQQKLNGLQEIRDQINESELKQLPKAVIQQLDEMKKETKEQLKSLDEFIKKQSWKSADMGDKVEFHTFKDLLELNTGDDFEPVGGAGKEDVLATVKLDEKPIAKIVFEVKNRDKYSDSFVKQTKRYMKRRDATLSIVVSKAMPKKMAVLPLFWADKNVLVVRPDKLKTAYFMARYALVKTFESETKHKNDLKKSEQAKKSLENMRKLIEKIDVEEMDSDINECLSAIEKIKDEANKLESTAGRHINRIREYAGNAVQQLNKSLDNNNKIRTIFEGR